MNASRAVTSSPDGDERRSPRTRTTEDRRREVGPLGRFVDRREIAAALRLLRHWPHASSLLWLPCRDAALLPSPPSSLPARVFLADYRRSRLEQLVREVREPLGDRLRARAVDVPLLDWTDGPVDLVLAPGVLSRLAVPADRRLFLARLAEVTRFGLCVSARLVAGSRRSTSAGFSGLGPDRPLAESALRADFEAVGLKVVDVVRVLGRATDRHVFALGPLDAD